MFLRFQIITLVFTLCIGLIFCHKQENPLTNEQGGEEHVHQKIEISGKHPSHLKSIHVDKKLFSLFFHSVQFHNHF